MSYPKTYSAYRRTAGALPLTIEQTTESLPISLGPNEVLVKIHAVSLNFRDVGMLVGRYPALVEERGIACSDCAAEVVAVGSKVTGFRVGDRVSATFSPTFLEGDEDGEHLALGGEVPGVLREWAVFEERILVKVPEYMSWEQVGVSLAFVCSPCGRTSLLICVPWNL